MDDPICGKTKTEQRGISGVEGRLLERCYDTQIYVGAQSRLDVHLELYSFTSDDLVTITIIINYFCYSYNIVSKVTSSSEPREGLE